MKNESPEKQLVNEIKNVSNILVTVSSSPSVDQLASALALAIALDKLDKRTVAVFSGEFPSVIKFFIALSEIAMDNPFGAKWISSQLSA